MSRLAPVLDAKAMCPAVPHSQIAKRAPFSAAILVGVNTQHFQQAGCVGWLDWVPGMSGGIVWDSRRPKGRELVENVHHKLPVILVDVTE